MRDSHERAKAAYDAYRRGTSALGVSHRSTAEAAIKAGARSNFSDVKEHALNAIKHSVTVMNHPEGGKPSDPEARKMQESARKMLANSMDEYGKRNL